MELTWPPLVVMLPSCKQSMNTAQTQTNVCSFIHLVSCWPASKAAFCASLRRCAQLCRSCCSCLWRARACSSRMRPSRSCSHYVWLNEMPFERNLLFLKRVCQNLLSLTFSVRAGYASMTYHANHANLSSVVVLSECWWSRRQYINLCSFSVRVLCVLCKSFFTASFRRFGMNLHCA